MERLKGARAKRAACWAGRLALGLWVLHLVGHFACAAAVGGAVLEACR